MSWHCVERGHGRPLVLLHGIGMSHTAWMPVIDRLADHRRVLAFDIPGFGRTPPLTGQASLSRLLDGLRDSLAAHGIHEPVAIAGNSMGGWLTLAAARAGLASSVAAISPAGLCPSDAVPAHIAPIFDITRWSVRNLPDLSKALLSIAPVRSLALAVPVSVRGHRIPAEAISGFVDDMRNAPGFDTTYNLIDEVDGLDAVTIPMSIAFGRNDWILTGPMRSRSLLPAQARWLEPRGWGHVPMWDDPQGVADFILDSTA